MYRIYIVLLLYLLSTFNVYAEPVTGHIKAQHLASTTSNDSIHSLLDYQSTQLSTLDFRAHSNFSNEQWALTVDYELTGQSGSSVEAATQIASLLPAFTSMRDDSQWFDLSHTISTSGDQQLLHRLDRLFVQYSDDKTVIKLGRQALSWGNGLVFRPMDLFNPFSPDAVDTSYKPGTDMLYGQWLFSNGSDMSFLIIPRRNPVSDEIEHEYSSAAVKWHYFGQTLQGELMLAVDYDDTAIAIGLNGPIAEALWRIDIVPVFLEAGGSHTSLVINIDTAWQWLGKNYNGYVEYYRNGFGLDKNNYTMTDIPVELVKRLSRAQVFNTGRDYLAGGLRIEWSALLQLSPC